MTLKHPHRNFLSQGLEGLMIIRFFNFAIFYDLRSAFKVLNFLFVFHPELPPLHEMCGAWHL